MGAAIAAAAIAAGGSIYAANQNAKAIGAASEVDRDLVRRAAGEVPGVAEFRPVDAIAEARRALGFNFGEALDAAIGGSSRISSALADAFTDSLDTIAPGSRELASQVTDAISEALANGGIPPGTVDLLNKNFADLNRVSGRGGGVARTASALGLRDVSLAQTNALLGFAQNQINSDRTTARSLTSDPLALSQFAFITPQDAIGAAAFNNTGRQAQEQAELNAAAAGDPAAALELKFRAALAGGSLAAETASNTALASGISDVATAYLNNQNRTTSPSTSPATTTTTSTGGFSTGRPTV